jgi:hypothetical protein
LKQFTLPALVIFISLIKTTAAFSQKVLPAGSSQRCGTTDRVETMFRLNPGLRNIPNQRIPSTNNNYRTETIVNVPVVIHIVLTNPWIVTDADVQGQIDRLNLDYSGLNPDTSNAGSFVGLRGHSQIQFCLARRTPGGQLTNGVERLVSSAGSDVNLASDPIKHAAQGGLDVWDPNSYLNIWVGVDISGQGILGYAQFPGTTPVNEDGVFLNYQSFGGSACYTISVYNKGRTGTHEVGHYFGLFHIWGDENACNGDDFQNLSAAGSSVTLPANLANGPGQGNTASDIGDTPNQAAATTNCPGGVTTDACAGMPDGKMYQDYMDYTQDACYSMFTKKQVERMEWVLDNARTSLKTSLGCQPPASTVSLDALPFQSVNPGGMEAVGCTATSYPSVFGCASTIQPKLRIKNNGLTAITSVTAGYRYDNGAAVSNSFVVNIPVGGTTVVTLPSLVLSTGSHALKFFTSNPNSGADQTPANDTLISNFTVAGSVALPITEQFTGATFPPAGWTINNPDAGITWARWTGTSPNGVPYSSPGSAWLDVFSYSATGQKDFLWSPSLAVSNPADSIILTFQVAHRQFSSTNDTLELVYSSDCGVTWQRLGGYYKWSGGAGANALATVTPSCPNCDFGPSSLAQWRQERIGILPSSLGSPANLMIGWKTTNEFGNNIFIDDINITEIYLPPTITSFTPVTGVPGTTVNITGTNFSNTAANNTVFFGAVKAAVNTATSTSLSVTSPAGATFQPLTVLNKDSKLMGSASKPFITTFDNPLINGISSNFYEFKTNLATGTSPRQVVMADLDADGKSELISADFSGDSITIFRNISTGGVLSASSFAAGFKLYSPTGPINLATGDLDGDGKPDIVVVNATSGTASVYRNIYTSGTLGVASFTAVATFPCGTNPGDISIADLDKDGKPDLAITSPTDNTIAVLKNNSTTGTISFLAKQNFTVNTGPNSVTIADFDGDGKLDLASTNGATNVLSVLRNTTTAGTMSFAVKVDFASDNTAGPVEVVDLDDDGKPEMIILDSVTNILSVFRNTSTSGVINASSFGAKIDFTTGTKPVGLAVADMDGDGHADIVYTNSGSNTFSVLRRNSSPGPINVSSFDSPTNFTTANVPGRLALGDLDGDGIPEVNITGFSTNVISIWQLRPVYTFKGTGNWSIASNWANNKMPPGTLPSGHEIIINPSSGNSVKDIPVILSAGSKLTVMPGKTLMVP